MRAFVGVGFDLGVRVGSFFSMLVMRLSSLLPCSGHFGLDL